MIFVNKPGVIVGDQTWWLHKLVVERGHVCEHLGRMRFSDRSQLQS